MNHIRPVANRSAQVKRLADAVPAGATIYAIGLVLLTVSLWNFVREAGSIGVRAGPVLAASINVTLSVDGGLGLHIVDTILDRVGGDICVEGSDLGGIAFVVSPSATGE